jgi:hypothetical protein
MNSDHCTGNLVFHRLRFGMASAPRPPVRESTAHHFIWEPLPLRPKRGSRSANLTVYVRPSDASDYFLPSRHDAINNKSFHIRAIGEPLAREKSKLSFRTSWATQLCQSTRAGTPAKVNYY